MENKEVLLTKLDKIHTTERGIDRIKKNLNLGCEDAVAYCKEKILDKTKNKENAAEYHND